MDDNWILIEQDTGLHVGWYFWLRVLDEVNRSARYGNPFGLLLLDAEDGARSKKTLDEAASAVAIAIRSTDIAGRLAERRVGVILLEQDADGAKMGAERVLKRIAARSGFGWRPTLLAYPGDGGVISNLLTQGTAGGQLRQLPA